jgi:hypothetical protein
MLVESLRRHAYDKQLRAQGCVYEISDPKHFKMLELLKKVKAVEERREEPQPEATKPARRTYRRRDMQAERTSALREE